MGPAVPRLAAGLTVGHLGRIAIPFVELAEKHRALSFVETGAGFADGGGVRVALRSSRIQKAIAIDVRPEALIEAGAHVTQEHGDRLDAAWAWEFILGRSVDVLPRVLALVAHPVVWWLDAHLPTYYATPGTWTRDDELPLQQELAIILADPRSAQDVILIDDWRLYRRQPWTDGDRHIPTAPEQAEAILAALRTRHLVTEYPDHDEGYLVAEPRP